MMALELPNLYLAPNVAGLQALTRCLPGDGGLEVLVEIGTLGAATKLSEARPGS